MKKILIILCLLLVGCQSDGKLLKSVEIKTYNAVDDTLQSSRLEQYDKYGNLVKETLSNAQGHVVRETESRYENMDIVYKITTSVDDVSEAKYYYEDKLTKVEHYTNQVLRYYVTFAYENEKDRIVINYDSNGKLMSKSTEVYVRDNLAEITYFDNIQMSKTTMTILYNGDDLPTEYTVTEKNDATIQKMTYDEFGNMTSSFDENSYNFEWDFEYDKNNNIIEVKQSNNGVVQFFEKRSNKYR